jgi:hypothetical protein
MFKQLAVSQEQFSRLLGGESRSGWIGRSRFSAARESGFKSKPEVKFLPRRAQGERLTADVRARSPQFWELLCHPKVEDAETGAPDHEGSLE